jgi:hypothetical protein
MALDTFLGLEPYLDQQAQQLSVPARQREVSRVFAKYCFRGQVKAERSDAEGKIAALFGEIVKRFRGGCCALTSNKPLFCGVFLLWLTCVADRCSGRRTDRDPRRI